jgi:hypothetical protein
VVQEPLSPELALVDPELAARARAALPELRLDEAAPRRSEAPRPQPPSRARGRLRAATVVVLVVSITLNVDLLTERRSTAEAEAPAPSAITAAPRTTKAAQRTTKTAAGGVKGAVEVRKTTATTPAKLRVRPRPRSTPAVSHAALRWPKAHAAHTYDVVIWRGHRRVADVWTTRPQVDLRTLPCVERRPLATGGRYLWFVYPLLRSKPEARFGPLIRWGVLDVPAGGLSCGRETGARSRQASPSRRP